MILLGDEISEFIILDELIYFRHTDHWRFLLDAVEAIQVFIRELLWKSGIGVFHKNILENFLIFS